MSREASVQVRVSRQVTLHDGIVPWQGLGPLRRRKQAPEEQLMIAVLHDALECLEDYRFATSRHERRLFDQAKRWILADDTQWPYSFERICGALDLDANTVRRRLVIRAEGQRASRIMDSLKSGTNGY